MAKQRANLFDIVREVPGPGVLHDLEQSRMAAGVQQIHLEDRWPTVISKFKKVLILAEEEFLLRSGWELIETRGLFSMWRRPDLLIEYSRNQAILITKAEDKELGIY